MLIIIDNKNILVKSKNIVKLGALKSKDLL